MHLERKLHKPKRRYDDYVNFITTWNERQSVTDVRGIACRMQSSAPDVTIRSRKSALLDNVLLTLSACTICEWKQPV